MKNPSFDAVFSKTAGMVFLLAGAFFVCSTILSMRAVFADPIAGYGQSGTSTTSYQQSQRTSPRSGAQVSANRTGAVTETSSRANASGRVVSGRSVQSRTTAAIPSRNVTSRATGNASVARTSRNVISRVGVNSQEVGSASRVSLSGTAIRASTGTYGVSASKLYTGTYSTIVDPTTGLISADAYSNCMESYYACMDEICTARNEAQRRCACASRVKTFTNVESQLQEAKEDLLNVSGQLSLLIASKGKDISSAFQLTDAEKVLNCVSYRDASQNGTLEDWCENHTILVGSTTSCTGTISAPSYCSDNDFGWGTDWMDALNGADSDILAGLQTYASTIDEINVVTTNDSDSLVSSYLNVNSLVSQLNGTSDIFTSDATTDVLAQTWGYDLFAYAHNNVCSRVLDSCFNGIYETCGANNGTTGPYNYNSKVTVTSDGGDVNVTTPSSTTATASCYGYTTSSGDPYSSLRKPVADSRKSVIQKYLLDANADCDVYGEELKTQATNMAYQKIAATQLLQKKRLEFQQEAADATLTASTEAKTNFGECMSELWDCYETQNSSNATWSTSRIKSYCVQVANSPHCYEEMICSPTGSVVAAVIDKEDSSSCLNSNDVNTNTCRNVTSVYEILNGASSSAASIAVGGTGNSAGAREQCLVDAGAAALRNWTKGDNTGSTY